MGLSALSGCGAYQAAAAQVHRSSLQLRLSPNTLLGFIDGTVRGIARPKRDQRLFYNGHKRKHAMKFQGVITPDGLFVDLWGPVVGTRHDSYLLEQSGLLQKLSTLNSPQTIRTTCMETLHTA
ncbi:unnamed protein product [Pylaiella littoralis]